MIKQQLFQRFSVAIRYYEEGKKDEKLYNLGIIAFKMNRFLDLMRIKNSFSNSLKMVNTNLRDFSTKWVKPHYFKDNKSLQLLVLYFIKDLIFVLDKRKRDIQDAVCRNYIQLDKVSVCKSIAILEKKLKNAKR